MSGEWPFTVHQNANFHTLITKLTNLEVIVLETQNHACHLSIKDSATLLEVFRNIFFLYASPNEPTRFCKKNQMVITRGEYFDFFPLGETSEKAREILNTMITGEANFYDYENGFNAMIAVYLGRLQPLDFIYPNTYIVELGKKTHEFDILLGTQNKKCVIIETTLGFNKEIDGVDESYTWHFKKALFRKWMVEKLYQVECVLYYITLKAFNRLAGVSTPPIPDTLSENFSNLSESSNLLIEKLLEHEGDAVQILDLGKHFEKALNIKKIDNILQKELIDKVRLDQFPLEK
jgi:hypothetical protein